jgi:hypothetical protein
MSAEWNVIFFEMPAAIAHLASSIEGAVFHIFENQLVRFESLTEQFFCLGRYRKNIIEFCLSLFEMKIPTVNIVTFYFSPRLKADAHLPELLSNLIFFTCDTGYKDQSLFFSESDHINYKSLTFNC